jgi:hypothetical protein
MISSVGIQMRTTTTTRPQNHEAPGMEPDRSKSAQSIGQLAKAQVVETGNDAPSAVGKAAAMLAKLETDKAPVGGSAP